MKGKQLVKLLEKHGFKLLYINGSHHRMINSDNVTVTVPVHGSSDVPKGTEIQILKDAGLRK